MHTQMISCCCCSMQCYSNLGDFFFCSTFWFFYGYFIYLPFFPTRWQKKHRVFAQCIIKQSDFVRAKLCDPASNIQFNTILLFISCLYWNEEGFSNVIGVNFRSWFTWHKSLTQMMCREKKKHTLICGVLMNSLGCGFSR